MNNQLNIQLNANASGLQQGISQGIQSLRNFGHAANAAAQQQERASRAIERSLQREIALLQAGERSGRAYYESLAQQTGADINRINPLINQLETLRQQTNRNTISVGQFNNAMRMMPAQMTDIVTQLAGGQSPFLIAIQQGGQMRDSFGGFGNMFRGIASAVSPMKLAVGGAVGVVGTLAYAVYEGSQELSKFENALTLSGSRAGLTADSLSDLAARVGDSTQSWGAAREAVLAFAQQGKIAESDYAQFAQSVIVYSQASGKEIADVVAEYAKIGEDPVKAVEKLSGSLNSMTAEVYAQVRALVEQGKEQEAVRLVQQKFAEETGRMGETVKENLGYIEKGWLGVKNAIMGAWDAAKAFGREETMSEQITEIKAKLADLNNVDRGLFDYGYGWAESAIAKEKATLQQQLDELQKRKDSADIQAAHQKQQAKNNQRDIAFLNQVGKLADEATPRMVKLNKEIESLKKGLADFKANPHNSRAAVKQAERDTTAAIKAKQNEIAEIRQREAQQAEREKKAQLRGTPIAKLNANQQHLYRLAKQAGEDPAKWLALYEIESGSGRDMRNPSGATGHFQIIRQLFKDYGVTEAGAMDLATSFHAVRKHHARGSASLKKMLGRDLTAGEYYLGHQQGWGGAKALLSHADMNVVDALSTIMSRQRATAQVVQNGGKTHMTARRFASMWISKANKLQQKYAGKGIGSLDSDDAVGLMGKQFELSSFDKYQQSIAKEARLAREKAKWRSDNPYQVSDKRTALLASPDYETWTPEQQKQAMSQAASADHIASQEKLTTATRLQVAELQKKHDLIGKITELDRLRYETESGSLKYLAPETKAQLLTLQEQIDAKQHQFDVDKKYADLLDKLAEKTRKDFDKQLFQLSLLGKTSSEIDRLSTAREYDQTIMEATAQGASTVYIDALGQQKVAAEQARVEFAKLKQEHDENWVAGISDGLVLYVGSFKSMREEVAGLVQQTATGMTNAIADFVATGKGSFRDFSVSVLQDISKMMTKMAIFNAMKMAGNAMASSGGWIGALGSAMSSGFSDGGYTGHGGKFEPAGIVHKGEYVLSQENLRALGGVSAVEGLLQRAKGYSGGGLVGGGMGILAHTQAVQAATPTINITVNVSGGSNQEEARKGAEEGVQAGLRKMMSEIADSRIFEQCRPGNAIYNVAKA